MHKIFQIFRIMSLACFYIVRAYSRYSFTKKKNYDRGSAQFITYVGQNVPHAQKCESMEKLFI